MDGWLNELINEWMSNIFKHNSTKLQLYQSYCLAYIPVL